MRRSRAGRGRSRPGPANDAVRVVALDVEAPFPSVRGLDDISPSLECPGGHADLVGRSEALDGGRRPFQRLVCQAAVERAREKPHGALLPGSQELLAEAAQENEKVVFLDPASGSVERPF